MSHQDVSERMSFEQPTISTLGAGDLDRSGRVAVKSCAGAVCVVGVIATVGGHAVVLSRGA